MNKIKCNVYEVNAYAVVGNTDTCEGRGSTIYLAICKDPDIAKKIGIGKGVMGTDCPIKDITVHVIVPVRLFSDEEDWDNAWIGNGIDYYGKEKKIPFIIKEIEPKVKADINADLAEALKDPQKVAEIMRIASRK